MNNKNLYICVGEKGGMTYQQSNFNGAADC